jgi:hypothetical protein
MASGRTPMLMSASSQSIRRTRTAIPSDTTGWIR